MRESNLCLRAFLCKVFHRDNAHCILISPKLQWEDEGWENFCEKGRGAGVDEIELILIFSSRDNS